MFFVRPLVGIFAYNLVKILRVGLNICIAFPSLKAILKQYHPKKDGRAALLRIMVSLNSEYFGLEGVTLVVKQLESQACVGKMDPSNILGDVKE